MPEMQEAGCPVVSGMEGRSVINILKEWEGMCNLINATEEARDAWRASSEEWKKLCVQRHTRIKELKAERDELKAALVDALNTLARAVGDGVDAPDGDSGSHCETCLHEPKSIMEHPCNVCMYRYASRWTRKRG